MRSIGSVPPLQAPRRRAGARRLPMLIVMLAFGVCLVVLGIAALALWQAREDAFAAAEREARNVVGNLAGDVARTIRLYDGLLRSLAADVGEAPARDDPATIRRLVLDRVGLMPEPGGVVVLDAHGRIIADTVARPPSGECCADLPAFTVQRDREDVGLFVSGPEFGVDAPTDARIVMSRRIGGADKQFAGVVLASLRIAYLRDLFRSLDLGSGGSIAMLTADGYIVARQPSTDGAGDVLAQMPLPIDPRERFTGVRTVVRPSPLDGVERLYAVATVGDLPLVVVAGLPVAAIYRDANARAVVAGGAALVLAAVFLAFAFGLRHELIHRDAAETLLDELAVTDPLTNLANRRRFEEVLAAEWRRALRNRMPLAVMVVEVDNFMAINNRYGAATGDTVLRGVARAIAQTIRRPGDLAARFGGNEFVVILPDTAADGALLLAERMRVRTEEVDAGVKLRPLQVTVSIGVGWGYPDRTAEPEDLLAAADRALDEAKAAGRNRAARVDLGHSGFALVRG